MERNTADKRTKTDWIGDLPLELACEIFERVPPKNIIILQRVNRQWCELLKSEEIWKRKCVQYWPNYRSYAIDNHYKFFLLRGGVYFIDTLDQLKKLQNSATSSALKSHSPSHKFTTPFGLGFVATSVANFSQRKEGDDISFYMDQSHTFIHHNIMVPKRQLYEKESDTIHFVFENVMDVVLEQFIIDEKHGNFSEKKVLKIAKQLMEAIKFASQKNTLALGWDASFHFLELPNNDFELKIFEFKSLTVSSESSKRQQFLIRDYYFIDPALMMGQINMVSDTWHLGTLLYYIFYGPFIEGPRLKFDFGIIITVCKKFSSLLESALSTISDEVSSEAIDFIKQLLQHEAKDRLTLEEAMKHPWIMKSNPSDVTLQKGLAAHKKRNPLLLKK